MNGLVGLGAWMFQNSGLTSAIIPSTITSIGLIVVVIIIFIVLLLGNSAFYQCSFLTSVVLTNGLVGLGGIMFVSSGLTSVIIPSTITSIGLIVVVLLFFKRRVINRHSQLINNKNNNHIYEISK